jgi:hypothetical protein
MATRPVPGMATGPLMPGVARWPPMAANLRGDGRRGAEHAKDNLGKSL